MKPSAIYRKAAELVFAEKSDRSCYAVHLAEYGEEYGSMRNPTVSKYIKTMLGTYFTAALPWHRDYECEENRDLRVWLLLMMSAIAADEERSS